MSEASTESGTLDFGDYTHRIGDEDCGAGWCGSQGYPKPCDAPDCTGLIHANFGDESWDSYWLDTKCDVCGEAE